MSEPLKGNCLGNCELNCKNDKLLLNICKNKILFKEKLSKSIFIDPSLSHLIPNNLWRVLTGNLDECVLNDDIKLPPLLAYRSWWGCCSIVGDEVVLVAPGIVEFSCIPYILYCSCCWYCCICCCCWGTEPLLTPYILARSFRTKIQKWTFT